IDVSRVRVADLRNVGILTGAALIDFDGVAVARLGDARIVVATRPEDQNGGIPALVNVGAVAVARLGDFGILLVPALQDVGVVAVAALSDQRPVIGAEIAALADVRVVAGARLDHDRLGERTALDDRRVVVVARLGDARVVRGAKSSALVDARDVAVAALLDERVLQAAVLDDRRLVVVTRLDDAADRRVGDIAGFVQHAALGDGGAVVIAGLQDVGRVGGFTEQTALLGDGRGVAGAFLIQDRLIQAANLRHGRDVAGGQLRHVSEVGVARPGNGRRLVHAGLRNPRGVVASGVQGVGLMRVTPLLDRGIGAIVVLADYRVAVPVLRDVG